MVDPVVADQVSTWTELLSYVAAAVAGWFGRHATMKKKGG